MVDAVTACKEFTPPGLSCAEWRCTLILPHSFAPGYGRRVEVTGEGTSKDAAGELACLRAVAELISESPQNFVLRPKHWMVSPDELVAHLPGGAFVRLRLPFRFDTNSHRDNGCSDSTPVGNTLNPI